MWRWTWKWRSILHSLSVGPNTWNRRDLAGLESYAFWDWFSCFFSGQPSVQLQPMLHWLRSNLGQQAEGRQDHRVCGYSTNLCHSWGTMLGRGGEWKGQREGFCMFRKKLNLVKGGQHFYWPSEWQKLPLPPFLCKHRYTSKCTVCLCVCVAGEMI